MTNSTNVERISPLELENVLGAVPEKQSSLETFFSQLQHANGAITKEDFPLVKVLFQILLSVPPTKYQQVSVIFNQLLLQCGIKEKVEILPPTSERINVVEGDCGQISHFKHRINSEELVTKIKTNAAKKFIESMDLLSEFLQTPTQNFSVWAFIQKINNTADSDRINVVVDETRKNFIRYTGLTIAKMIFAITVAHELLNYAKKKENEYGFRYDRMPRKRRQEHQNWAKEPQPLSEKQIFNLLGLKIEPTEEEKKNHWIKNSSSYLRYLVQVAIGNDGLSTIYLGTNLILMQQKLGPFSPLLTGPSGIFQAGALEKVPCLRFFELLKNIDFSNEKKIISEEFEKFEKINLKTKQVFEHLLGIQSNYNWIEFE